jgi:hypothetical protein
VTDLDIEVEVGNGAGVRRDGGGGHCSVSFPSVEGLLPSQGVKWSSGSGANWSHPGACWRLRDLVGLVCNFTFVLDLAVRSAS